MKLLIAFIMILEFDFKDFGFLGLIFLREKVWQKIMLLGKILLLLMAKIENIILPSGHTEWPTLVVYVKENIMTCEISLQNGLQR